MVNAGLSGFSCQAADGKRKDAKRSDDWIIRNNGEIVYPYAEAVNKGIGRREFRNAIDELMNKGFLDITHHGSGGRSGDMTKYFLADRWKDYGTPSFRPPNNPRPKDTRNGRGWNAYHEKRKIGNKSVTEKGVWNDRIATPKDDSAGFSSNKSATSYKGYFTGNHTEHKSKMHFLSFRPLE
ncbi:MAG: hypothetical protein QTN59_10940 [Candidatus Electrothrix communis]|nr:MAG: hypothetical protein QTN59_10940 [Candidatus Electrothrix communis]